MIRHLLATTVAGAIAGVRRAAGDPFIIAGLGLILAGSGMQGVVDRLITVRDEVTAALEQLAELPHPEAPSTEDTSTEDTSTLDGSPPRPAEA